MPRPKNGKRLGNTKADQNFILDEMEAGRLRVIEPSPDDPPFSARLAWSGMPEDRGSPWQYPSPGDGMCTGKAFVRDADGLWILGPDGEKLKRPCAQWAMPGADICVHHGGGLPIVRQAALTRMVAAADAATGALLQIGLDKEQEGKVRVMAINSILDRAGLKPHSAVDLRVDVAPYESLLEKWKENGVLDRGQDE